MEEIRQKKWFVWALAISLFLLTLTSRICLAYYWPVDGPGDGVVYTQIAKNVLEQSVYSLESEAPFTPTLVRLPGYPLFISAVYSIFGHDNNTAVRAVQAVFDTFTCVIVALLAFLWTDEDEKKRRNAFFAFLLAAACPFIAIYAATLLTETLTTFLMAAMTLTATLAFKTATAKRSLLWWALTGLGAGAAVTLRPDSGLFAAGIGLTLVISGLFLPPVDSPGFFKRLLQVLWKGGVFSLAFVLVLTPWTVRNYRLFGLFQPLAPAHAEMPGEFVPHGYDRWLRTWVDDFRFVEPTLWNLDEKPILIAKLPPQDFDSPEERDRVAALFDEYNHPPGQEGQYSEPQTGDEDESADDTGDSSADDSSDSDTQPGDDENSADAETQSGDVPEDADEDDDKKYVVRMTPEIDAGFGRVADERIARSPARYYLFLPAKRAAALWFDSHSLYYPFGGQISPVMDIDYDVDAEYWLPAFTAIMWLYTLLGLGGALFLWRRRADKNMLRWLILAALMTLPRIVFFSSVENPEPRYVVELFAFTALLGGIFLGGFKFRKGDEDDAPVPEPAPDRVLSLDVFRGITIAAMVLVNEPGTWSAIYPPLAHAEWNGATPADWVFPFFLFIVGVSIAFALGRQTIEGVKKGAIYRKVFKRSLVLFALGVALEIFPFYNLWTATWFEPSGMRIMGVLQRIAICYLISSLIFLHTLWRRQVVIVFVMLLAYWALLALISVPGCEVTTVSDKACNLASYLDRLVLGPAHIWNQLGVIDPEGLLSTLPAIATTLVGVLTGQWLRSGRDTAIKFTGMLGAGAALTIIGWVWSFWFPLNKSLWTSSYVLYTGGLALIFLALCYWLVDLKGHRRWAGPCLVFGSNAIALYVGSTLIGKTLDVVELAATDDKTVMLQEKIFNVVFLPLADPAAASLLYAISFVLFLLLLLWPLYRKQIFVKI